MLVTTGHLDLKYKISASRPLSSEVPALPSVTTPELYVELSGPDTPLLIDRNGELLHAIEHIAAKILQLEPEHHDRISFDADNFKANRDSELRAAAGAAIASVRATGKPYAFPPMNSRERRLLHLALSTSGLPTSSNGENPRRYVVLYPEGYQITPQPQTLPPRQYPPSTPANTPDRANSVRNSFRRR